MSPKRATPPDGVSGYTPTVYEALGAAKWEAYVRGAYQLKEEHLLVGLLGNRHGRVCKIMESFERGPDMLERIHSMSASDQSAPSIWVDLSWTSEVHQAMVLGAREAEALGVQVAGPEHVLLGLLQPGGFLERLLESYAHEGDPVQTVRQRVTGKRPETPEA